MCTVSTNYAQYLHVCTVSTDYTYTLRIHIPVYMQTCIRAYMYISVRNTTLCLVALPREGLDNSTYRDAQLVISLVSRQADQPQHQPARPPHRKACTPAGFPCGRWLSEVRCAPITPKEVSPLVHKTGLDWEE